MLTINTLSAMLMVASALAGEGKSFVSLNLARFDRVRVAGPDGTLLNVNGPPGDVKGACACRLGKRVYNDKMELTEEGEGGRADAFLAVNPAGGAVALAADLPARDPVSTAHNRPDPVKGSTNDNASPAT